MKELVEKTAVIIFLITFGPALAARDGPDINVEIVNYFLVPDADFILGMDYDENGDRLFF